MSGSSHQLPRPLLTAMVAALLAVHAWLALSATIELGVTGDETVHLTGGYSYWRLNDYRLHPENGNLPQRWAALPLVVHGANFQPQVWERDWAASDVWMMGQHFFFESGNAIDYELLWARAMMLFWSVGTGLLVYFWSRSLWGDLSGLFSLVLYTLSPTVLAHAPLVTSDTCAAFWLVAATGAWWHQLEAPSTKRLLLSLAAFSLASVSKFSGVLLTPVFVVLASVNLAFRNPCAPPWKTAAVRMIALLALHGIVAGLVIWAFFGFRYFAFAPNSAPAMFFSPTAEMLPSSGLMRSVLLFALQHHLLPEGFLHGFTYVLFGAQKRAAFAAGEYSNTGWWWFFPFAFWVKSSLAELLANAGLLTLAVGRCLKQSATFFRRVRELVPLLTFAGIYSAAAVASHLNIGQRHLLPLYPVLFIFAGALAARGALRWLAVSGLILAIAVTELVSIRPHYLAFFNCAAGGPENGWRLLGDSSLDWGQSLPQLKSWLDDNKRSDEPVYLSYFGCDDPFFRQLHPIELAPYFRFGRGADISSLKPGLYCIGASMLQDAASPYRGQWTREHEALYEKLKQEMHSAYPPNAYATNRTEPGSLFWHFERARFARLSNYLRVRKPDEKIGHAIFVYRLSAAEIDAAVNGSMNDLAALLAKTVTP